MSSNPLLQPLVPEQASLLEVVATVYEERRHWPTWQYVETQMRRQETDATAVLQTLPRVGSTHGIYGLSYGLTWPTLTTHALQPGDLVGLTIAGLHRAGADDAVTTFLAVLDLAIQEFEDFEPQPDEASAVELTSAAVKAHLSAIGLASSVTEVDIYQVMEREPAFWGGSRGVSPDGSWRWEITREIRQYIGSVAVNEYVDTVRLLADRSATEVARFIPPYDAASLGADVEDGSDQARAGVADASTLDPQVPLLGSGIDAELWDHVRPLVAESRWEQVAREAAAFVETRTRTWTGSNAQALDLMSHVLRPEKVTDKQQTVSQSEAEGWYLMARGFFQAIRNHVMHNEIGVEREFQFGLGALGVASLLIGRIRQELAARAPQSRAKSIPERLVQGGAFAEGDSLQITVPAGVAEDRGAIQNWLDEDQLRSKVYWRPDSREPVRWAVDDAAYNLTRLIRHIVELATGAPARTQVWGPNWYRDHTGRPLHKIAETLPDTS
jgi:hypothetical protein